MKLPKHWKLWTVVGAALGGAAALLWMPEESGPWVGIRVPNQGGAVSLARVIKRDEQAGTVTVRHVARLSATPGRVEVLRADDPRLILNILKQDA